MGDLLRRGAVFVMDEKKQVEFRYYDIPKGDIVFSLTGENWNKVYGEGKEKLHFHNYYEVGICHVGEGEMTLGEQEFHFYPGCISIIPTTELHTTNTFGKKAAWEWMYFDLHEALEELYPEDEILRENVRHMLQKEGKLLTPDQNISKMSFVIKSIFSEMQQKEYMYRDMVNHFLLMLLVEIIRKMQNQELPDRITYKIDIFPAIDYIKHNYHTAIRISDLSRSCGMSESYFRKVFERYMNMKPLDYLNFVRIQKSCSLLCETDLTVAEISERVGYESVSSFIRNFRHIIGCTPLKWKKEEEHEKSKLMNYNITALKGWLE